MSEYLFGIHSINAVLTNSPEKIVRIYTLHEQSNTRIQALLVQAEQYQIPVELVKKKSLEKMAKEGNHQNIIAAYKPGPGLTDSDLWKIVESTDAPLLLMLDGVTDPHNLGACLRSADAAGVDAVIIPKHRSAGLTPISRKVAAGAAEVIPLIQVSNLAQTLDKLKEYGVWSIGMSDKATVDFYKTDLTTSTVMVMGAEGTGIRPLVLKHCDYQCSLPMSGSVSSLNVSVATGVCLYEALRQRESKDELVQA